VIAGTMAAQLILAPAHVYASAFAEACQLFADADAVFVGRAEPAETHRVSFEAEVEKARAKAAAAQSELECAHKVGRAEPSGKLAYRIGSIDSVCESFRVSPRRFSL
jgi:hypothetical protein